MRRLFLRWFVLITLASLMLTAACTSTDTSTQPPTPTPIPTVAANKPNFIVQRGDVTSQAQFSGRVVPVIQEQLFFRSAGRVRKVYVRSGDAVKTGQLLADLVSLDQLEMQASQQQFNQRKAEIALELARLNQQLAATQEPSWNPGYETHQKIYQYQVELAQIELDETGLQTRNLNTSINDAQIISPIDGKVLSIAIIDGSEIHAFNPLITVGDDSKLEIGATLTTTVMQDFSEGMVSMVELSYRPGEDLLGKIRSLPFPFGTGGANTGPSSSTAGQATENTARISLDNTKETQGLQLGDLVKVTVILESKQGVLWLPPQAIRVYEGRYFVVVKTDTLPKRVDVRLGIRNQEQVEILEGVEEGQTIIAP